MKDCKQCFYFKKEVCDTTECFIGEEHALLNNVLEINTNEKQQVVVNFNDIDWDNIDTIIVNQHKYNKITKYE